jgi:hypothetical protein
MNFTYQNHLKYHINDVLWGHRNNSIEKFKVSVGSIDHDHFRNSSYQSELRRTADLVYQNLGKDFVLFLSGGTDSEIVARNFLEIGIKPKCVTIKFENDYNISDVNEALEIANNLNVPIKILNFKIKDFVNSGEANEFGKLLQCSQITYLMVYSCIKKIGLPAVMGGELLLKRNVHTNPSTWYYCFRENEDASAMRFSSLFNIPLINEWFSYTPELMLHYLEHEDIKNLVSTKYNYKLSSVSSKNNILTKLIPDIRVKTKTHGFEKLLGFNLESNKKLSIDQIMRLEHSLDGIEFNNILSQLKGQP